MSRSPAFEDEYETGYRPAASLTRMLEENRWGAAVERSELCDAGECNERENSELIVEEETEQKSEEEAGGGDLLPEMDRAEPLGFRPRLGAGALSISDRGRTGKQGSKEATERTGITMIMRVGDQEQECDREEHEDRCPMLCLDACLSTLAQIHLLSP